MNQFEQSAYVGYTATPFANIFIDPEVEHETAGQSLFPRSFILSLPAPSNYVGPSRVFGLQEDVTRNIEPLSPLPMLRPIGDWETWIPDKHKKDYLPGPMPASLKEAVLAFIVTVAARRWRGQGGKHNSMLVHVTRFTAVQKHVRQQVQDELSRVTDRLRHGDPGTDSVWLAARHLYEDDYQSSGRAFAAADDISDQVGSLPAWDELAPSLVEAAAVIEVREVNGTVKDSLDYFDHSGGLSVIAVGGAKLSRGLTLEGLSVSYYLAGSRMYDTLMQMGRWFGYRPGYLDLCRLYTTPELNNRYALITAAAEELYREFDYMVAAGSSPREFGLRVQQHPDGLMVTAPNKMKSAQLLSMSFAGNISETVLFETNKAARKTNWSALERLVGVMPQAVSADEVRKMGAGSSYVWKNIPASVVTDFLGEYVAHPDAYKVQPTALRDYILGRTSDDPAELTEWWVLLANSTSKTAVKREITGLPIGLTKRSRHNEPPVADPGRFSIRRLVSPPHEQIDVVKGSAEYQHALSVTAKMWADSPRKNLQEKEPPSEPAGVACRNVRSPSRGLLLLYPISPDQVLKDGLNGEPFVGFALSFPGSEHAKPINYQVAKDVWQRLVNPVSSMAVEDEDDEDSEGLES